MREKIKTILESFPEIDGFKIIAQKTESVEVFLIKKTVDMHRTKKVAQFRVTVYKDFEADGVKYRGSSTTQLHPTMSEREIREALNEAAFAARFVRNKHYPLVKPTKIVKPVPPNNFAAASLTDWLPKLTKTVLAADTFKNGWLNSAELFLNKVDLRIMNSEGLDLAFENYRGELEFITNWQEAGAEVELYQDIHFAAFKPESVVQSIRELLELSREKALAKPTPALKRHTILLTGEPVREFMQYYYIQSNAQSVYEQTATMQLGEKIQGANSKGDLLSIKLTPFLENSTESRPFDEDGVPLEPVEIFQQGTLVRNWGNQQYSHYLNVPATGNIRNMVITGGSKTVESFKKQPYLELFAFSDFQMDPLTGNFGGEIRLGKYFDGNTVIPVSGGSISGNIKEVQSEMFFSEELQRENNFCGPKTIQLFNVAVTGAVE
jgi:predicted Zn-dependent protease